jgi:hypothetical protein
MSSLWRAPGGLLPPPAALLLGFAVLAAGEASAQDHPVEAHVAYLTAEYVYLDIGRDQGVHTSDTLTVFRADLPIGMLRVQGVSSARSVTMFAGPAFGVAVGDTLWVTLPTPEAPPVEARSPAPPPARVSLLNPGDVIRKRSARPRREAAFSGRVRVGTSVLRTQTKWQTDSAQQAVRTFATPTVSGRLVGRGLPGATTAVMRFSVSRRLSSGSTISPTTLTRVQQVSLLRALPGSRLELETGRFQFREDPARTYWDGARAAWQGKTLEWGVAAGFEPDRFNGQVQTSVPKIGSFLRANWRQGELKGSTTLSGVLVRPSNEWVDHTYVGLRQDLRYGSFRWKTEVQADRDPSGGILASRVQSSASIHVGRGFVIRPRISIRQPFSPWRSSGVVGTRRSQESLGLSWSGKGMSATASWTQTAAAAGFRGTSYSGGFSMADVGFLGIGAAVSGGLWSGSGNSTRYGTLAFTRPVLRGMQARATYQMYQSAGRAASTQSHSLLFGLSGNLGSYLDMSAQIRRQFSSQTSSNSLFLSLGYRF